MKQNYAFKDIIFALLFYLILLMISGYYKYEIIYDRLINTEENFYNIIFITSNIMTCLVAVVFVTIIIFLVWFTMNVEEVLTRGEFIYGSTFLVFTLSLFELIKFAYILFNLKDQIKEIAVDQNFLKNILNIDFVVYGLYSNYLSYFFSSVIFVSVLSYSSKKINIKILEIGFIYFAYFSFVQYIFS